MLALWFLIHRTIPPLMRCRAVALRDCYTGASIESFAYIQIRFESRFGNLDHRIEMFDSAKRQNSSSIFVAPAELWCAVHPDGQ